MRKIIVTTIAALLLAGGATAAFAGPENGKAGPNGHNNFGLCTAHAHNNDHAKGAPPFAALEQAAADADQTVAEWCAANAPHPGGK